jgi:hypothetical protein
VEHDVMTEQARPVRARFELAACRMAEAWLAAGRVRVSASDMKLAREFLEQAGWRVEDTPGCRVRVVTHEGHAEEMTREAAVLAALRRLAEKK